MRPVHRIPNVTAQTAAADIAELLTIPPPTPARHWQGQSLADGAAGIALLHAERAHTGLGAWATVHAWLTHATQADISAHTDAGLFFGAPALAFVLHAADADQAGRYARSLIALDRAVVALAHCRIDQAHARIDRGELPGLAEFDLIYGLAGIGAHLLRHAPGNDALQRVLSYLVRLTEPLHVDGETLPGWWTSHGPDFTHSSGFRGGHGNFGMAHGIAGPLALLALAMKQKILVEGHATAINRICRWLDAWRHDGPAGPWWPQWITRDERRAGRVSQPAPLRPSWCYGTPGLARAQQLVGIAIGDGVRQRTAEHALAGCLSDPKQLARIVDSSLCHGWAGLYQTARRAAADAITPAIVDRLPDLTDAFLERARPGTGEGIGFLEGDAGLALTLHTAAHGGSPTSGWDACLLIA